MPFCRDCGKEVEIDWVACPFCGATQSIIPTKMNEDYRTTQDPLIQLSNQINEREEVHSTTLISDNTINETEWSRLEKNHQKQLGIEPGLASKEAKWKCVNCGWWGKSPKKSLWWGLCCPNCPSGPFSKENKIIPIEYTPQEYSKIETRDRAIGIVLKIVLLGIFVGLGIINQPF